LTHTRTTPNGYYHYYLNGEEECSEPLDLGKKVVKRKEKWMD
jgi:hypothetical protein